MTSGLSVVDIMNLPPVERQIMQLVMRSGSMTYPQLRDAVASMPAEERLDDSKLNATLDRLLQEHWLVRHADGKQTAYRASEIRRTGAHNPNLWRKLEAADSYTPDACPPTSKKTTSGGKRALPSNLWDCLLEDKEQ